jgi:hypothetical protein
VGPLLLLLLLLLLLPLLLLAAGGSVHVEPVYPELQVQAPPAPHVPYDPHGAPAHKSVQLTLA